MDSWEHLIEGVNENQDRTHSRGVKEHTMSKSCGPCIGYPERTSKCYAQEIRTAFQAVFDGFSL